MMIIHLSHSKLREKTFFDKDVIRQFHFKIQRAQTSHHHPFQRTCDHLCDRPWKSQMRALSEGRKTSKR